MKPLLIISNYDDIKNPYYGGGGAIGIHEVAKRLARQFQITVLTGKYPDSRDEIINGVYYHRIGLGWAGAYVGQLCFQFLLPFCAMFSKYNIWGESFTPPFSTACLQLFTRKPVVGIVHMLSGEDMRRKYLLPFDWAERIGLKFYKHFIVTSANLKEKIRLASPTSRIDIIPNGVESVGNFSRQSIFKKHVLFMGRIEINQKGLDLLLSAYSSLPGSFKYPLVIAGSGVKSEMSKLEKIVNDFHLTGKVKLVGRVEGQGRINLYKNAACVVVPSRFETFSLVALETLSCGLPLICFDIPGLSWIPNSCKVTVPEFDTKQLAKKIFDISSDSLTRRKLASAGLRFSGQYSWDKLARRYNIYFQSLISHI